LLSSDSDSYSMGSVSPACLSSEWCLVLGPMSYRCTSGNSRPMRGKLSALEYLSHAQQLS
jgi:hypothetical protein